MTARSFVSQSVLFRGWRIAVIGVALALILLAPRPLGAAIYRSERTDLKVSIRTIPKQATAFANLRAKMRCYKAPFGEGGRAPSTYYIIRGGFRYNRRTGKFRRLSTVEGDGVSGRSRLVGTVYRRLVFGSFAARTTYSHPGDTRFCTTGRLGHPNLKFRARLDRP